jgi:hypothetical protein
MANWWYDKGLENFAKAGVNWLSDDIKFSFVDAADYTLNTGEHEFWDEISGESSIIASSGNLSGKNCDLGVLDASDETVNTVTGDEFEYIILWKDTGTPATSPVLFGIDTASGLPFTPSGSHIQVQWDSGEYKMAKL